MTIMELLKKFEDYYGKEFTDDQRAAFIAKLDDLEERDLPRIYSEILENCKRLPTIADVYIVAREWNLLQTHDARVHLWQPTSCKLCAGEGRITTVWMGYFDELRQRVMERLEHIMPYTSAEAVSYRLKDSEYTVFARCKCEAGASVSLPPKWPRWSADIEPVRFA